MNTSHTHMAVLMLDRAGNPVEWVNHEMAIHLVATERVLAPVGEESVVYRGGVNAITGLRSEVEVSSILLTNSRVRSHLWTNEYTPPLTNRSLFVRDNHLCLYCGYVFQTRLLTRDHVIPKAQGGLDLWSNVVTACKRCNNSKGARTPEQWGTKLLGIPYTPCHAEHLLLKNRAILADQMAFLQKRIRKHLTS